MSISNELTRLQKAKTDIKAAIEEKGVTVPSNDRIDKYSTYISQISSGASLNIAYGNTAPSDTSKLWIKGSEANNLLLISGNPEPVLEDTISTLPTTLPTVAQNIGVASVSTKIYLFGGNKASSAGDRLNTIQVFDTTNNTISKLSTTLPTAADGIGVASVSTKIYLFGGGGGASNYLNTINVFDTANNTITTLSITLPTAAQNIGVASVGDKVYLFGGRSGNSNYLNTISVFDTLTNTISTLSTILPTAADGIGVASVGNKIYLFGGYSDDKLNTINVFDTANNTITTLSTRLPTVMARMGTAAVGTRIYLFGGNGAGYLNTIQVFDTVNNTISTLSITLPTAAQNIGVASVGDKVYLFGGRSGGVAYLNTINEFLAQFSLTANSILITEGQKENIFNLLSSPTQVEISVKNVYRGNSSNVAELNDAYLYNGSVWLNVNE